MPAPLLITYERVTWRLNQSDLNLLRAVYGEGKVNEVARALIGAYCGRLRAKGLPTEPLGPSTNSAPPPSDPNP